MKKIDVHNSVGTILCHDVTQIIPGKVKDAVFKKGHIITENDVPILLSIGKDNIYVWEEKEGYLHENEAAARLKDIVVGKGLEYSEVKEGKINLIASYDGLLKVNEDLLLDINCIDEIAISSIQNNYPVKKGMNVAGTRVIPLLIDEKKILEAESIAKENKILNLLPYKKFNVGVITTGNEVYYKRITDKFGPVIKKKIKEYNSEVIDQVIVPDDSERIALAIKELIDNGADMIICTGGMSVDPDDVTPTGIRKSGARIISYGSPVLPGSMFLLSYLEDIPILGLPGCVMYNKTTVFDLIIPRVLVGENLTKRDIAKYGHGGYCLNCDICHYPNCSFGK